MKAVTSTADGLRQFRQQLMDGVDVSHHSVPPIAPRLTVNGQAVLPLMRL